MGVLDCIKANAFPIKLDINFTASRVGIERIEASASRFGVQIEASVYPVCPIKDEEAKHVPFLVKEGVFILNDGSIFKVLRT